MAHVGTTRKAYRSSTARRYSTTLLSMAIALLSACGGGADPNSGGGGGAAGGGGGSIVACASGPAPTVITWDAVAVAAGYRIYFGTSSGIYLQPSGVNVFNVTSTSVPGLSSGTTYYFSVTAYDVSNNESVFSNEVCKTIS